MAAMPRHFLIRHFIVSFFVIDFFASVNAFFIEMRGGGEDEVERVELCNVRDHRFFFVCFLSRYTDEKRNILQLYP